MVEAKVFAGFDEFSEYVKDEVLLQNPSIAVYAFNATGKTRLARSLSGDGADSELVDSIVYSAEFEDTFVWDNDDRVLRFGVDSSWILGVIADEGLENQIAERFRTYFNTSIEPVFDFTVGAVAFSLATGDDDFRENIKVSRGEESLLIWAIFATVLNSAIDALGDDKGNRSIAVFDKLKYVVIDDPISSIDDAKVIFVASEVADITKRLVKQKVNVIITTHHALFFNVIVNSLRNESRKKQFKAYSLFKGSDGELSLKGENDSPFAYHLHAKSLLQAAFRENAIERYHFNMFRAILEKTANFLGYTNWALCLDVDSRSQVVRLLHNYSHGRISDMEPNSIDMTEVAILSDAFDRFVTRFNWSTSS